MDLVFYNLGDYSKRLTNVVISYYIAFKNKSVSLVFRTEMNFLW